MHEHASPYHSPAPHNLPTASRLVEAHNGHVCFPMHRRSQLLVESFPTIAVVRGRAKVGTTARPVESCASFAVDLRDSLSATATACATISSPLDRS
jgi:hypothetical protein